MSDSFNGYHVWLGIPLAEQPPNHYRLLGISIFESDLDVIDHAADRQMAHVRTFQSGRNGTLSQQILNELAQARVCLLSPEKKSAYDDELRAKISAAPVIAAVPMGKALPVAPVAQPAVPLTAKPVATPAKPAEPMRLQSAQPAAAVPKTAAKIAQPVAAKPSTVARGSAEGDDPFGLQAASGRRPIAAGRGGSLFDDAEIAASPKIHVDLARRSANADILIQKLAIYGFVAVASLVILMVAWNTLTKNFGPPSDWFKAPVTSEPASEPIKHPAPPAPTPGLKVAPQPAPGA
jgi:hypothetical protein